MSRLVASAREAGALWYNFRASAPYHADRSAEHGPLITWEAALDTNRRAACSDPGGFTTSTTGSDIHGSGAITTLGVVVNRLAGASFERSNPSHNAAVDIPPDSTAVPDHSGAATPRGDGRATKPADPASVRPVVTDHVRFTPDHSDFVTDGEVSENEDAAVSNRIGGLVATGLIPSPARSAPFPLRSGDADSRNDSLLQAAQQDRPGTEISTCPRVTRLTRVPLCSWHEGRLRGPPIG